MGRRKANYEQIVAGQKFRNENPEEAQQLFDSALQILKDELGERRHIFKDKDGGISIERRGKEIKDNESQTTISLLMDALYEQNHIGSQNTVPIYNRYASEVLNKTNQQDALLLKKAIDLGIISVPAMRIVGDAGTRTKRKLSDKKNFDEVSDSFIKSVFAQGSGRNIDTGSPVSMMNIHAGHREDANLNPKLANDLDNINPTQSAKSNLVTAPSGKGRVSDNIHPQLKSVIAQRAAAVEAIRNDTSPIVKYTDDPDDYIPVEFDADSALKSEKADEILRQIAKERVRNYKFNNQNNKGNMQNALRDVIDDNEKNLTINTGGGPVYLGKGINGNGNGKH